MSGVNYDYIETFIKDMVPEHFGVLREIEEYAKDASIPILKKEVASLLELMVRMNKPLSILELGTAIGYSSILMALSTEGLKKIVTIEKDIELINIAKENINKSELNDVVEILQGDCIEVLKNLENKFDFIFIDAGKGHYNHYLPYCLKLLKKDGIIFADNVLFRGMVASKDLVKRRKITIVKRMREFLKLITSNEDLMTSILPIGDGVSITIRR